ncbi:Uu.00g034460.m01.CDS01 [Anthostomella pinea]|uniref:Uu.00g034460.m01.CDS01 n=1 Tax=Anthostomella pinea TaxID=933095 RepID=A0AAI8V952_9PEZI|nr:Uu.00g034460.m01.CDS01 [Anthostomella pinea]
MKTSFAALLAMASAAAPSLAAASEDKSTLDKRFGAEDFRDAIKGWKFGDLEHRAMLNYVTNSENEDGTWQLLDQDGNLLEEKDVKADSMKWMFEAPTSDRRDLSPLEARVSKEDECKTTSCQLHPIRYGGIVMRDEDELCKDKGCSACVPATVSVDGVERMKKRCIIRT